MRTLKITIIAAIVSIPILMVGCESFFPTQAVKDAAISSLEGQAQQQQGVISGLAAQLEQMALDVASRQNITEADRDKLLADLGKISSKMADAEGKYGPLVESLLSARDKPTSGEALGNIGSSVSALLPYPFNLIGGMVFSGLLGGAGMQRRGRSQTAAVVESIAMAATNDGNGGMNIQLSALGREQKKLGVQGIVDSILEQIEIKRIRES